MKKTISFVLLGAAFGLLPATAAVDCIQLSLTVKHAVAAEKSKVLEIVSTEVSAAPDCACEIVKAAIEGSSASAGTVAAIVEAAAIAAPEQVLLVARCAVAVAPDALGKVQAALAKLKAPVGEVAAEDNPLDFPGDGPIGPTPGGPGGSWLITHLPPIFSPTPGVISPPDVTNTNP